MEVLARFKGKNGSCGYEHGREYTLAVATQNKPSLPYFNHLIINPLYAISGVIKDVPYETMSGFLKNWEVIK